MSNLENECGENRRFVVEIKRAFCLRSMMLIEICKLESLKCRHYYF